jgi:protein gp37
VFLTKRPERAAGLDLDWPTNVWLGTSVGSGPGGEYPDTTHRIDQLQQADAPTLWVSFEPLIEPIGEVDLTAIDWAVVGGETAPEADRREMQHEWARDLLRQCRRDDVAFFFKQSSGVRPESGTRLSVYNEEFDIYEQRRIREFPDP